MATVSLQTAFDSARRAIETGAADKAIGIAQHILVHFPRMIEGHRLLGEAYLNANEPEQAVAAFEQVLQADPENVAAYYGLGLAQQSLDRRAAAISGFERALEIQPNLADLRTQLMRLYSETPGSSGQFRLSRAGLGRLYARGGMFGQAIDEFRAVLDADPDRDDVKVALAEALWRDNQEDEATDFCRDVLERRPELLKPTVLLGYMLFAGGQPEGEALWRRAAEQDASMNIARTLFDILPPIRLEEPVLPEFDEAEWRAQESRRSAAQPLQSSVAAVASDDDFFADSWLSSAGSSAPPSSNVRTYDMSTSPAASFAAQPADDDDLLASLLGFADESAPQPAATDFGSVEPFGLDDWDRDPSPAQQTDAALPPTLDQLGLPDATSVDQDAAPDSVKPFSFDDWGLEDEIGPATPSAQKPASQQPGNQFDLAGIEAFSFDDDTDDQDTTRPFSFEAESAEPSGVTPFSLEDELDELGGVQPFALDMPGAESGASTQPSVEAGLGAVQPFSLDEWGLDESGPSLADATRSDHDDLGDFKPFSLDELSLDSLESDTGSSLSGPQIGGDAESGDDASGFSWEEPSWRTQRTNQQSAEPQEGESIFAKLMRSRPQEPPPSTPPTDEPLSVDEDEPAFFSVDEEPLRLDLDTDQDGVPTIDQLDMAADDRTAAQTAPSATDPSIWVAPTADTSKLDFEGFEPTFGLDSAPAAPADDTPADLSPVSFDDLDQSFSWEQPEATQPQAQTSEPDANPFSLSDLGFSDDELAALDAQPAPSQASPAAEAEVDLTPFSLADLGLSDEELAALDLQDDLSAPADVAAEAVPETTFAAEPELLAGPAAVPAEAEVDLTPFSLADLGLNDDELALLNEQIDQTATDSFDDLDSSTSAQTPSFAEAEAAAPPESIDATVSPDESDSWFDLPVAEMDSESIDDSLDALLTEAEPADHEAGVQPIVSGADQPSDMSEEPTPFSLVDLGLSDEELALFEQIQGEQQADETPERGLSTAPETPSPEADADRGFEDAFEWSSTQANVGEPFTSAQPKATIAEEQPAVKEPAFEWPFVAADADTASATAAFDTFVAQGDLADDSAASGGTSLDTASLGDESTNTLGQEHVGSGELEVQPLPLDLPEGAQSVAATAQPPIAAPVSQPLDAQMDHGLTAIHAQLAADPENHAMRLAVARMSQHTNALDQAIEQYKQLIKRGELLDDVVDDLQDVIVETDDPQILRRLHRLLGDAYMKQNRFREAMDEYSWTLARRS